MSPSAPRSRGGPAEVPGAESMVGLLINTVPVRAHITPATTTADLLDQLQQRPQPHTRTPAPGAQRDPPRHRPRPAVRHPVRLRELPGRHRRVVGRQRVGHHRVHHPRIHPLPADSASPPGHELGLRVEFDTDVFDAATHRNAHRAVPAGVGGHDRRPHTAVVVDGCARCR